MPLSMPRDTSLEAWRIIQHTLQRQKLKVYNALYANGPLTRSELDQLLKGPNEVNPSYHKRLPELQRLGCVRTNGERPCTVTGFNCLEWDVTSALPAEPAKHKAKMPDKAARVRLYKELKPLYMSLPDPSEDFYELLCWLHTS